MTFGFSDGSRCFRERFPVPWGELVLHGYDCDHGVAKFLYHDCKPLIASRFTIFGENFVTCCHSSRQTFLLEVPDCQCVVCKEPLDFWSSMLRNISTSGSE